MRIFTEGYDAVSKCFASEDGKEYKFYTIPPYDQVIERDDDGIYVKIDLNFFIEKIYVSPLAERWFFELVKSITKKYNLSQIVEKSDLLDPPTL